MLGPQREAELEPADEKEDRPPRRKGAAAAEERQHHLLLQFELADPAVSRFECARNGNRGEGEGRRPHEGVRERESLPLLFGPAREAEKRRRGRPAGKGCQGPGQEKDGTFVFH